MTARARGRRRAVRPVRGHELRARPALPVAQRGDAVAGVTPPRRRPDPRDGAARLDHTPLRGLRQVGRRLVPAHRAARLWPRAGGWGRVGMAVLPRPPRPDARGRVARHPGGRGRRPDQPRCVPAGGGRPLPPRAAPRVAHRELARGLGGRAVPRIVHLLDGLPVGHLLRRERVGLRARRGTPRPRRGPRDDRRGDGATERLRRRARARRRGARVVATRPRRVRSGRARVPGLVPLQPRPHGRRVDVLGREVGLARGQPDRLRQQVPQVPRSRTCCSRSRRSARSSWCGGCSHAPGSR